MIIELCLNQGGYNGTLLCIVKEVKQRHVVNCLFVGSSEDYIGDGGDSV